MKREFLGIYIEGTELKIAQYKGKKHGLQKGAISIPHTSASTGIPTLEQLKRFLASKPPSRKRRIVVVLPRHHFFIRDIELAALSPSEARSSVKMSIALHAHLPEDEISYDIFTFTREGKTHVLLIYVQKNKIEPILEIFKETGHRRSLYAIIPPSVALDCASRELSFTKEPYLCLFKDEGEYVLSMHGIDAWEGSHRIRGDDLQQGLTKVLKILPLASEKDHPSPPIFSPFPPEGLTMEVKEHPLATQIKTHMAPEALNDFQFHAITGAISASFFPPISVHGPRKKPIRININLLHIATIFTLVLIIGLSIPTYRRYLESEHAIETLKEQIEQKKKGLEPLKEKGKKIEEIEKKIAEIKKFTNEFPNVLDILDELARLTPDDAWIKTFNLTGQTIRLSAEGPSAVAIMSEWRKSRYFDEVRLVSPVTKSREGLERFSVEIRLKVATR